MPLSLSSFPFATPYDPSEDPPTSIDPLGTVALAERLADILLPGMTARMWRVRLLTFSAVAAHVADRATDLSGRDGVRDEARLAFERLFVSALVRRSNEDEGLTAAIRRVTGTDRAREALRANEPLTRPNFLKGQMNNGPTGVMARLARHTRILDDYNRLGPRGWDLLAMWSADEGLPGVLKVGGDAGLGGKWITKMAHAARNALEGIWPGPQSEIWKDLVRHLRPDGTGASERRKLKQLLWTDSHGFRGRALDLLTSSERVYQARRNEGRGTVERAVLRDGLRPQLEHSEVDRLLRIVLDTIEAFERCSCLLQSAFDTVRWTLSSRGSAEAGAVLEDSRACKNLERVRRSLNAATIAIDASLATITDPAFAPDLMEPLRQISSDARRGEASAESLVDAVLERHERVQKEKNKGCWIERGRHFVLMPGFGLDIEAPPFYEGQYLHSFRLVNSYVVLGDLGLLRRGQDAAA
jgi:hypothetical protein